MRAFAHDPAEIIRATQGQILVYYIPIGKIEFGGDLLCIAARAGAIDQLFW
jgi:hypothetical protein